MPTSLVNRIDLDLLYPPFRDAWLEVIGRCKDVGAHYYAVQGTRTFPEQAKLYFQGRTLPGARVTNAQPGLSCHNYGIAVDVCRDADLVKVNLQPYWAADGYTRLKLEGEGLGLSVGVPSVPGGDGGHVQLPLVSHLDRKEVSVLTELKVIHGHLGLSGVWAKLDEWGFPELMASYKT